MRVVGTVESLWRYAVKSMAGEELQEAFIGFPGVYGDRVYAFHSSAAQKGFPYLTAREQEAMLLYRPRYRHPERATEPLNLAEAEALGAGATPLYAEWSDLMLDVETPSGERLAIDDPRLMDMLGDGIADKHDLTLLRSSRSMTDCRPVSMLSVQSVRHLSTETGIDLDKRRFRANLYIDLGSGRPFGEEEFVGRTVRIGDKATIAVVLRDSRCKMITLDPDTAQPSPRLMTCLARDHEGKVGIYGVVLVEGTVRHGDPVALLD